MAKYLAIGLMSGTSLDGLDICACEFNESSNGWEFTFLAGETIPYSEEWKKKLSEAPGLSGLNLMLLNNGYGRLLGEQSLAFIQKHKLQPQIISSHGHTIFHQPENQITLQIGSGACITAITKLPVVSDFRAIDVALGGQGAPLVPAGEKYLFPEYPYLINLGGFANITINKKHSILAFDICPANIVLNELTSLLPNPLPFDPSGEIASKGQLMPDLLKALNELPFYMCPPPKSLGREWVSQNIWPLINKKAYKIEDALRTFTEHIAEKTAEALENLPSGNILISGGGAFNTFLVERIKTHTKHPITIPPPEIINFKEAIIFAFLGVLRLEKIPNALKSVTGAKTDNIGGAIFRSLA
jgi:anhydro-N-acetylmuramic acid kinase